MALVLGTNCGFVTTAPTSDPQAAFNAYIDYSAFSCIDTAPAGAKRVTEIGWWCDTATDEANFEVGLYSDAGANEPESRLYVDKTNAKGTDAGWKVVSVDWEITPGTTYWLAVQLDDTVIATYVDYVSEGFNGLSYKALQSWLPIDWGTSTTKNVDGFFAIYAVVELTEVIGPFPTHFRI